MNKNRSEWLIPASLIALSLVPALAGSARMAELVGGAEITAENARFFASPAPVMLHIPAVILFSIVGAFQFMPAVRRRWRTWHRVAGMLLIPAGLVVALSGMWMAHFYTLPANDGQLIYLERLVFGTAMALSIVRSVIAIGRRDYAGHGEWMIRAYAIGLGAGTQVLTHLPWFVLVGGMPGELPRAVFMGAAWVINILVAEGIILRLRDGRQARAARGRSAIPALLAGADAR